MSCYSFCDGFNLALCYFVTNERLSEKPIHMPAAATADNQSWRERERVQHAVKYFALGVFEINLHMDAG
jgi:hypothetical protein